eukprot:1141201-Pelagomonas_calceolata.AAC.1
MRKPNYLLQAIMATRGGVFIVVDGDKTSNEVAPNKGLKQGCLLSPLLYTLLYVSNKGMERFLNAFEWGYYSHGHNQNSTQLPTLEYNGTALEIVTEFKYLGLLLSRDGKKSAARSQMARNFMGGIAGVHKLLVNTVAKYGLETNFPTSHQQKLRHRALASGTSIIRPYAPKSGSTLTN